MTLLFTSHELEIARRQCEAVANGTPLPDFPEWARYNLFNLLTQAELAAKVVGKCEENADLMGELEQTVEEDRDEIKGLEPEE